MYPKRYFSCLIILLLAYCNSFSQEIEFNVTIDKNQRPDLPQNLVDDVKNAIVTFTNTRRWTNDQFSPQEKIKCNMLITLNSSTSPGRYISVAQIQIVRPVYGTSYESVLLNFLDKNFDFEFAQGQPLDYNENVFLSNLASMLSFYCYIALALDYDSFGKLGGTPYIEKAFVIANVAQATNPAPLNNRNGWENNEFSNRMALIQNLNNQQFTPFREGLYVYHREAMDKFNDNPEEARKKIIEVLKKIKITRQIVAISILNSSFFFGKKDELIQIFSKATPEMKNEVLALLRELDAINIDKYSVILKN